MRKFFRYLINIISNSKKLCEVMNNANDPSDVDRYIESR